MLSIGYIPSGGSGSGSTAINGRVDVYADLPDATTVPDEVWLVEQDTGILFTRKKAGLYYSDGISWTYMPNKVQATFVLYDNTTTGLDATDAQGAIDELYKETAYIQSTGLVKGGEISINGGDNTLIDITAGYGRIIDTTTTPDTPASSDITWNTKTGYNLTTTADPGDVIVIFLSLDSNGDVVERTALPTPEERRNTIDLGLVARNDSDEIIIVVNNSKNVIHNPLSSMHDFFESWGNFSIEGNEINHNGANLQFVKSAGILFGNGVNFRNNAKNPNTKISAAQSPVSPFNYKLSDGTDISLTATEINPNIYDDGTSTPASVPTGKFTVQLITIFADSEIIEVFPGQTVYNLASEAKSALPTLDPESYKSDDSKSSTNLAFLIVKQGATDLTDTLQAEFFSLSKRGTLGGIGFQNLNSAGMVFDPGLTDNGDGTINVGDGVANLYQTTDFTDDLKQYDLTGLTNQLLTDNDTNYVVADFNSGSPIYRVTLNVLEINESDVVPVYTIYREGTELHILTWGTVGSGLVNKLHARLVKTDRFGYESGLALGEVATRIITTSNGIIWIGGTRTSITGANSSIDETEFWYHVSGVWTKSDVTQYNNTQYDDGTDLQNLVANRYAVNWIYQGVEEDSHLYYVLGSENFLLAGAQASQPPSDIPEVIRSHAVLVGRIIVVTNGTTAIQIDSAFSQQFVSAPTTVHDNLSNINLAGAGVTYGHINDQAQTIAGAKTFSSGLNIPTGQAYKINSIDINTNGTLSNVAYLGQANIFTGWNTLNGGVVVNEVGADVDFRVESNTIANLIFAKGSNNYTGFGVEPEDAWTNTWAGIRVGGSGSLSSAVSPGVLGFANNIYYDGSDWRYISDGYANLMFFQSSGDLDFFTVDTGTAGNVATVNRKMIIQQDGNVGIGVVPEAWDSSYSALQYGGIAGLSTQKTPAASNQLNIHNNLYYDGTWRHIIEDEASNISQTNGQHIFYSCPSATADSAATFIQTLKLTSTEVVINDASADIDFRVESNVNTHAFFLQGSNGYIGIGTSTPLAPIHIESSGAATARARVNATGTGGSNSPGFEIYNEGTFKGGFFYREGTDTVDFFYDNGSTPGFSVTTTGQIGTNGETSPDVDPGGLCLNQGANDTNIISFKSSDIAHGMTSLEETDTWYAMRKSSGGAGGAQMRAYTEGTVAYEQQGNATTEDTTTATNSSANFFFNARLKSGTTVGAHAAGANIMAFKNSGVSAQLFKADGDIYTNTDQTGGLAGTFDNENDILLARAAQLEVKGYKEHNLQKYSKRLQELGIMEGSFLSHRKITDLQLGAIGQLFNVLKGISKKLGITEEELLEMAREY